MRQIDEMIESDTQTLRAHAIYNKANIDVFDQKRNQSNRKARFFKKSSTFFVDSISEEITNKETN